MTLQFKEPTKAKLIDVNPRSEKHGSRELAPAIDLRFQMDVGNSVLEQFAPGLRDAMYRLSNQHALPGVDAVSDASELRFPELSQPLHWAGESINIDLTVDYGIGGESDIHLTGCKLHKHVLHLKPNGSCTIAFTCSCSHNLTEQDVGRLGTRVQHDVYISLVSSTPVEAEEPLEATA
jgi:hypothetical protein